MSSPRATFALFVRNGVVVEAAPISQWAVGERLGHVLEWWINKGADQITRLPSRPRTAAR